MRNPRDKIFITCAVTGNLTTLEQTPHLPITPEEIADACLGAAESGAAVVHIHVRDPESGIFSMETRHYREVVKRIRESKVDVIVNPILDTAYDGFGNLDFAPSTRVAYNVSKTWALALEEYGDFGPLKGFNPVSEQAHQLYGVFDWSGALDVEVGVGVGLTNASDKLTFKVILSRDLNKPRKATK